MIYGMVDRPLVLTMDELMRFPAVSRVHYIECIANAPRAEEKTLEQMHGMIGCSEWTGVPLSLLLKEVGVRGGASWVLSEGAEATKLGASMPMGKAMDDVLVAYGQNGEALRPHNGFPLRLVVPGFQGKYHVKWLRRIRVVDRPYITYWEKHSYAKRTAARRTGPNTMANSHTAGEGSYFMEQGPKSVITFPSGEQRLPSRGYYTINGLAWSGCGAVRRVEVSTNGGGPGATRSSRSRCFESPSLALRSRGRGTAERQCCNRGVQMKRARCNHRRLSSPVFGAPPERLTEMPFNPGG